MKTIASRFLHTLLLLGLFTFCTNSMMAQSKGTKVQTLDFPTKDAVTITKTYEFTTGGITLSPTSGAADYVIYERRGATGQWTKTGDGKLDVRTRNQVQICQTDATAVKVEVKSKCEDCVAMNRTQCN